MPKQILYDMDFYETVVRVHFHHELTKKRIEVFHAQECDCPADRERPKLITDLLHLEGVGEIHVDRYTYYTEKGAAFTWEEMIKEILFTLLMALDPLGELKQTRSAREYYRGERNELMYREKKFTDITDPFRPISNVAPPKGLPPPPPLPPLLPPPAPPT